MGLPLYQFPAAPSGMGLEKSRKGLHWIQGVLLSKMVRVPPLEVYLLLGSPRGTTEVSLVVQAAKSTRTAARVALLPSLLERVRELQVGLNVASCREVAVCRVGHTHTPLPFSPGVPGMEPSAHQEAEKWGC